ncbi:MAG TPA: hypothetical protein VHA06_19485 [Candidatus Angelobacter sp.]|nr:hypothetical protein [Candidatus Angelobacter sp.]
MSYLQRLAGSVIQPVEKVRPLVGSVFSANKGSQETEDFFSAAMAPSMSETATPKSGPSSESPSAPETLLPQNEVVTPFARKETRATAHEPNTPQPLLPTRQQLPAEMRERSDEEAIASPEDVNPREAIYTPLIANSPAFAAQKSLADVPPNFSSPTNHQKQKAAASRAAEREPDEIQIHIGRIEISAVPQTPAAPATKAARKSSSLDDYLRRRDLRSV